MKDYNFGIILLLIMFASDIIFGASLYHELNKKTNINFNVSIPSEEQINKFCEQNDYDYGWLSSTSCKINEVECYRDLGNGISQYKCLNWNENGDKI